MLSSFHCCPPASQRQRMLKYMILVFFSVATLVASIEDGLDPPDTFLAEFGPCAESMAKVEKSCLEMMPPSVRNLANPSVLAEHPELCCPAYQSFTCMREAAQKASACQKFVDILLEGFDKQIKSAFTDNGCHIEKCG